MTNQPHRARQVLTTWLLGSIQDTLRQHTNTLSWHTNRIRTLEGRMGALDDAVAEFRAQVDTETTRISGVLTDLQTQLTSGDANAAAQVSAQLGPVIDTLRSIGTGGPNDPIPAPGDGEPVPAPGD